MAYVKVMLATGTDSRAPTRMGIPSGSSTAPSGPGPIRRPCPSGRNTSAGALAAVRHVGLLGPRSMTQSEDRRRSVPWSKATRWNGTRSQWPRPKPRRQPRPRVTDVEAKGAIWYPVGWSTSLVTDRRKSSQIKALAGWVWGFWSKVPHSPPLLKNTCKSVV